MHKRESVRELKGIQAVRIEMDPGDMTKYRFVITSAKNLEYVIVASYDALPFRGYEYSISSMRGFIRENGLPNSVDEYEKWGGKLLDDPYILYIVNHSNCNRWTALAAILAVHYAEEEESWFSLLEL